MKKYSENTLLGLKALQRAAEKVTEKARKDNIKIPIWKNGKITFEIPQPTTKQINSLEG